MTGLFGKMPRHGDFVRLGLPAEFVEPWDGWASRAIAAARSALPAEAWEAGWSTAPPWRFRLAPGLCGPSPWAGVMVTSQDMVGRRFPLTVATRLADPDPPDEAWYDAAEAALLAARDGDTDAEGLMAALPPPPLPLASDATFDGLTLWWQAGGERRVASHGLQDSPVFARLMEAAA